MGVPKTILIVEDETDLSEVIGFNLTREGYQCRTVANGEDALSLIRKEPPDLVILDRMLPGLSGDDVIMKIRGTPATAQLPVIMLTAKVEEADELVGFALGADDYIAKPFSTKRLVARVNAILRRSAATGNGNEVVSVGPILLDRSRREVKVDDNLVTLTSTEFGILWELATAKGRVLSREQLIDGVLGTCAVVTDRTIDVHIAALRKKLGDAASLIQTIRGVGYTVRAGGDQ